MDHLGLFANWKRKMKEREGRGSRKGNESKKGDEGEGRARVEEGE